MHIIVFIFMPSALKLNLVGSESDLYFLSYTRITAQVQVENEWDFKNRGSWASVYVMYV